LWCWWFERNADPDLYGQHECWNGNSQCNLCWRLQPLWQHEFSYLCDRQGFVLRDGELPIDGTDLHGFSDRTLHRFLLWCWWIERNADSDLYGQRERWNRDSQCNLCWRYQSLWQHEFSYLRDRQGCLLRDGELSVDGTDLHRFGD